MRKKWIKTITVVIGIVLSMTTAAYALKSTSFADMSKGAYYYDAVNWAVENDITEGMGDNLFKPENTCTRAQVVTFLWRHAGEPQPSSRAGAFTDVEAGAWYSDAVLWAVENGVTDGMGNGTFQPDGTCTRGQIVTFLWKYAGKPEVGEDANNPFTDVDGDTWYTDAVLWAVAEDITTGVSDTSFAPNDPCTRGQIVTFLYRYDMGIQTEPPTTEPSETNPPATEPSVTKPPATEPSETNPPATEPSATNPPATEPSETNPPATEPSATNPPATEPSATNPPATEPSETNPPATEPSVTNPPTTEPEKNSDFSGESPED